MVHFSDFVYTKWVYGQTWAWAVYRFSQFTFIVVLSLWFFWFSHPQRSTTSVVETITNIVYCVSICTIDKMSIWWLSFENIPSYYIKLVFVLVKPTSGDSIWAATKLYFDRENEEIENDVIYRMFFMWIYFYSTLINNMK